MSCCFLVTKSLFCSGTGRNVSLRIATAASSKPSAVASQRLTSVRSRFDPGNSLLFGVKLSRYSTITRESNSGVCSSISKVGI